MPASGDVPRAVNHRPDPGSEFLIVGLVLSPWGVRGEIKIQVLTDFPGRFEPGRKLYLDGSPFIIERSRPHKDHFLLKLSAVDDIEAARRLQGKDISIPLSEAHALPEGEYYRFQILGLEVFDSKGEAVGRIMDILPTASNDVYIVAGPQGEVLVPATEDVIRAIDLQKGRMIIDIIDGLL